MHKSKNNDQKTCCNYRNSCWVPDYILTNQELEKMVDTNDEWIISRTGIRERHILKGEGKGTSAIGTEAVKGLLEKTGTKPEEVDMLIVQR